MEEKTNTVETDTVKFELTIEEANIILAALQELPHKLVNNIIQKIIQQANNQLISE